MPDAGGYHGIYLGLRARAGFSPNLPGTYTHSIPPQERPFEMVKMCGTIIHREPGEMQ